MRVELFVCNYKLIKLDIKVSTKDSAKDIAKALATQAEEKSIRMLTQQMTKTDLEGICEPLDIDYGEDFADKKPSRSAYAKRLYEFITDIGNSISSQPS